MEKKLEYWKFKSAYVCGQIFAVIVDIQRASLSKDEKGHVQERNAGIRERFFSFASTTPAAAFGRLMRMSQNHLTKIKSKMPGLFVVLETSLREVCAKLESGTFPAILTLEEQGQFALGYYHKKQEILRLAQKNAELKKALENKEEEDGDKE
jgi:CRISPR-associated protein Csd1